MLSDVFQSQLQCVRVVQPFELGEPNGLCLWFDNGVVVGKVGIERVAFRRVAAAAVVLFDEVTVVLVVVRRLHREE